MELSAATAAYGRRVAALPRENPAFGWLLGAASFAYFYAEFSYIVIPFVLLLMTDSPAWAGAVATAGYLPILVISTPAGWLMDRFSPRRLMMAAAAARGLMCVGLAALGMTGLLTPPLLVGACLLLGTCGVTQFIGRKTLMPSLVPSPGLPLANSMDEAALGLAETFGALLGGLTIAILGPHGTLFILAGLQACFIAALARIPETVAAGPGPGQRGLRSGFSFLIRPETPSRLLRAALAVAMGIHACAMVFFTMQVFYLNTELGVGSDIIGMVIFASSAVGIFTSLLTERLMDRLGVGKSVILFAGMVPLGLFVVSGSATLPFIILGATLILVGAKSSRVIRTTLCQSLSPRPLLGRVNGASQTLVDGMTPVAAMATGIAAKWLGFPATYAMAGCLALVFCFYYFLSPLNGLRRLESHEGPVAEPLADARAS